MTTIAGVGGRTYNPAGFVLLRMRLAQRLLEVGALVDADFVTHRCLDGLWVVFHRRLDVATVPHYGAVDAGQLEWLHVVMGAATVEGDHKTAFVNDLERQKCAIPEELVGTELCPPAAYAHSRDSSGHFW